MGDFQSCIHLLSGELDGRRKNFTEYGGGRTRLQHQLDGSNARLCRKGGCPQEIQVQGLSENMRNAALFLRLSKQLLLLSTWKIKMLDELRAQVFMMIK